jgi:hypothetical protein
VFWRSSVAVGVGFIGYAQFKTRKDVEQAVNARFKATVDKEIRGRISEIRETLDSHREDAEEMNRAVREVRQARDRYPLVSLSRNRRSHPRNPERQLPAEIREEAVKPTRAPLKR